jgi:hypothetical protein
LGRFFTGKPPSLVMQFRVRQANAALSRRRDGRHGVFIVALLEFAVDPAKKTKAESLP